MSEIAWATQLSACHRLHSSHFLSVHIDLIVVDPLLVNRSGSCPSAHNVHRCEYVRVGDQLHLAHQIRLDMEHEGDLHDPRLYPRGAEITIDCHRYGSA